MYKNSAATLLTLLVQVENTMKDGHYGISLVWVNPNQVRAATIEEAVKKLTACTSSGTDWPYALVQLYEGPHHTPLPKDKHPWASYLREKCRGNPLWADQPTQGLPTPCCWSTSHLSHRFERA